MTVARRIEWNTGRRYVKNGQLVIAVLTDDNEVLFNDTARGIRGTCGQVGRSDMGDADLRSTVMRLYDSNQYKWSALALTAIWD